GELRRELLGSGLTVRGPLELIAGARELQSRSLQLGSKRDRLVLRLPQLPLSRRIRFHLDRLRGRFGDLVPFDGHGLALTLEEPYPSLRLQEAILHRGVGPGRG